MSMGRRSHPLSFSSHEYFFSWNEKPSIGIGECKALMESICVVITVSSSQNAFSLTNQSPSPQCTLS
jgi:hypothetical protein